VSHVIYNLSANDHRVIKSLATKYKNQIYRDAKEYQKWLKKSEMEDGGGFVDNWASYNEALKDPRIWEHNTFIIKHAYPYMLRTGRTLRDSSEMFLDSDGEVALDEYYLLYDAVDRLKRNNWDKRCLRKEHRKHLDVDAIFNTDSPVYTDFYLKAGVKKGAEDIVHLVSYNKIAFSDKPDYQDKVTKKLRHFAQAANHGVPIPDKAIFANASEGSAAAAGKRTDIVNLPALQDGFAHLGQGSEVTSILGNKTQRQAETRGRTHPEGVLGIEERPNGVTIYSIYGPGWEELSEQLDTEIALPMICDWQIGSRTSVPEMHIRWLDMVRTDLTQDYEIHWQSGGDYVHGQIYKNHKFENEGVGMQKMDTQFKFFDEILAADHSNYTIDQAKSVKSFKMVNGNHEWQNGTLSDHGYSFHQDVVNRFKTFFRKLGYPEEEINKMVEYKDQTMFPDGSSIHSPDAHLSYGPYNMRLTHYPMDKGFHGSKGAANPAILAYEGMMASGENTSALHFVRFGHFHHFSFLQSGPKFFVGDPSMALMSGFEYRRGLAAKPGAVVLLLGGKDKNGQPKPPRVMVYPMSAIENHVIKEGPFSEEALNDEGFYTHPDYETYKELRGRPSTWSPNDIPKEALQYRLLSLAQNLSLGMGKTSIVPKYDGPETKIYRPNRSQQLKKLAKKAIEKQKRS